MNAPNIKAYIAGPEGLEGSLGIPTETIGCISMRGQVLGVQGFCEEMLSFKTPIKQRNHRAVNRKLQLLHVGVSAHRCTEI